MVVTDQGQKEGKQKYYPYGSERGQSGTITWLAIFEHNYYPVNAVQAKGIEG